MNKTLTIILLALSSLVLAACQKDNIEEDELALLEGINLTNQEYIKWLGRVNYDTEEETQYFYHTASGFSVSFLGTSLEITIHATNASNPSLRPYFSVLINEQSVDQGSVFSLTQETTTLTIAQDLEYGVHTITFLKRSEARDSLTSISRIKTDGIFLPPQASFDMNILILGGSGISGNGVFGGPNIPRTTLNSSSLHAFGYKVADEMNASVQFVASSGWGLKWGYNPTNDNGKVNIRTAFDKIGINDQQELVDIDFDYQSFIPDIIIINLGGNDYNAFIGTLSGEAKTIAEGEFQDAVIEFVTTLNTLYPNAYIYWTHTNSINGILAATVLSDLDPLRTFVEAVVIESPGSNNNLLGSGNHANEVTHKRNANILIEKINERFSLE